MPPGATVWRWRRWTRWSLTPATIAVAGLAVGTDIAASWMGLLPGSLGRIPVAGTVPIGIALGLMIGLRRTGLDRTNLLAWREFLAVSGVALVVGVWQYSIRIGGFGEAVGLVLAALNEELIYRLAVLVLAGAGVAKLAGRNWRATADWGVGPGVVAILASGFVFTLLPGHLVQVSDALHALPFVGLGTVLGYVVLRTGAILPAAMVHAVLNLATIAALSGEISPALRMSLAATALVALVLGTIVAGRRLGIYRREPIVKTATA